jgi:hypothetical protein
MLFSAAIQQIARRLPAQAKPADAARVVQPPPSEHPERQTLPELPAELDQRVRLIGEW